MLTFVSWDIFQYPIVVVKGIAPSDVTQRGLLDVGSFGCFDYQRRTMDTGNKCCVCVSINK